METISHRNASWNRLKLASECRTRYEYLYGYMAKWHPACLHLYLFSELSNHILICFDCWLLCEGFGCSPTAAAATAEMQRKILHFILFMQKKGGEFIWKARALFPPPSASDFSAFSARDSSGCAVCVFHLFHLMCQS